MLILEYFGSNFRQHSDNDINFFVVAAIKWLYNVQLPTSTTIQPATDILNKMVGVAEAVLDRGGRTFCNEEVDDVAWITALWRNKSALWAHYGPDFRRLMHCFEQLYHTNMLAGDKETIHQYLHSLLDGAHRGCDACESLLVCQWVSHV